MWFVNSSAREVKLDDMPSNSKNDIHNLSCSITLHRKNKDLLAVSKFKISSLITIVNVA